MTSAVQLDSTAKNVNLILKRKDLWCHTETLLSHATHQWHHILTSYPCSFIKLLVFCFCPAMLTLLLFTIVLGWSTPVSKHRVSLDVPGGTLSID